MFVRPNTTTLGFRDDQFASTNSANSTAGSVTSQGQRVQTSIHVPVSALHNCNNLQFTCLDINNVLIILQPTKRLFMSLGIQIYSPPIPTTQLPWEIIRASSSHQIW